ncbi:hypothetical protein A2473_02310 [candidate division WWE3 bacterium RIFOXYC2_FULL_42_13]|nr:MAG: hypothetical protein A2245_03475 [candidate division WWE3 bacterium RIFOXYA2_FULL_43_12]OGC66629.1 MAG: hypothetical protein A2274_03765 [candidate division WWE3 bacterium RIFOXYA12_FULL_43_11]OGC73100.1 MAG: hypothetical protein A2473_02310 [candidate division WWE3 bacterium RIFOXYC2_FULL_42_13]OGC74052.1 MAG: hypothetical protein A2337_02430 [candidate division WWE3 bacterium RIFOXYB2_FULL_43_9]OGC74671.1 MAG: hypothetical protein A2547_04195 [candidate division WWE3 bacterium RIFOXYD
MRNPRVIARKYRVFLKIAVALSGLFLMGYLSYKYIYLSPKFAVRTVSIVGGGKFVNLQDFRNVSEQKTLGRSIFSVDPKELERSLKSNFLGAKNVETSLDYPDTLVIKVEERLPVAVVTSGKKNAVYYLIDSEGYILGEVSDEFMNLPKIIYEGDMRVGSFLDDRVVPVSIEILSEIEKAGLNVSSISFRERYSKLYLGATEVYLSNLKGIGESVRKLEKLYKNLLLEGKSVIKIDLRYDKVIVLYE